MDCLHTASILSSDATIRGDFGCWLREIWNPINVSEGFISAHVYGQPPGDAPGPRKAPMAIAIRGIKFGPNLVM